jgi:hypothetical protein
VGRGDDPLGQRQAGRDEVGGSPPEEVEEAAAAGRGEVSR